MLADGTKAGVASEGTRAAFGAKQMSLEEASRILGVDRNAPLEEVLKVKLQLMDGFDMARGNTPSQLGPSLARLL